METSAKCRYLELVEKISKGSIRSTYVLAFLVESLETWRFAIQLNRTLRKARYLVGLFCLMFHLAGFVTMERI